MSDHALATVATRTASIVALLVVISVGLIIARHQRRNPIGWLLLAIPVFVGGLQGFSFLASHNAHSHPWLAVTFELLTQFFYYGFLFTTPLLILFFPDGRLPSPQWRRVIVAYGACSAAVIVVATVAVLVPIWGQARPKVGPNGVTANPGPVLSTLVVVLVLCCLGTALSWVVARVRSYRHTSGAVRQQYRWLALGAGSLLIALAVSFLTPGGHSTTAQVMNLVSNLAAIPFPVSIGVAILKYRLYDIDRIVSRTLSYALLTAILVGLYVGCVALATQLFPFSSSVGVAASTLVAVALFTPLRRRLQVIVDRRFNRSRYDAEATAAGFAQRLRDAVNPDAVRTDLLAAVEAAIEPQHMALWLAPTITH